MSDERGISTKAVFLGVVTDVGVSLVGGTALGVVLGIALLAQGVAPDELDERMQEPDVLVPGLLFGLAATAFVGFVAGRVAGRSEVLHGGLVGVVGIPLGLVFAAGYPLWFNLAGFAGVIPCALLGGGLAAIRRRPSPGSTDETQSDGADPGADEW
jgi:hypothetical protein